MLLTLSSNCTHNQHRSLSSLSLCPRPNQQIQMIQQMRRQLIASGVNPGLLPADIDLNMMSSEGLASVGAAMSGLQNATVTAALTREGANASSRSPSHGDRSRDSSPTHSESSHKGGDRLSSPLSTKSSDKDVERLREVCKPKEEKTLPVINFADKYLSPSNPLSDTLYCKDHALSSPLTRNPLEILQEKTAASLSSLPLPLGFRSSSSMDIKPPSSSSSLLNSSALFASSPSLSALQKETDALKPSPILPPLSIPMTAEDYKGYIQRGTSKCFTMCLSLILILLLPAPSHPFPFSAETLTMPCLSSRSRLRDLWHELLV